MPKFIVATDASTRSSFGGSFDLFASSSGPGGDGRISTLPPRLATGSECARPRGQQRQQADQIQNVPAPLRSRSLLPPGTGALRWQCRDAPVVVFLRGRRISTSSPPYIEELLTQNGVGG